MWDYHCFGEGVWAVLSSFLGPWGQLKEVGFVLYLYRDKWLAVSGERRDVMTDSFAVRLIGLRIYKYSSRDFDRVGIPNLFSLHVGRRGGVSKYVIDKIVLV